MKRRVLGLLLVTALLPGVSAIAAACGGGEDELSLEEYFQQFQTISDDSTEREEALESEFQAAFDPATSEETSIDAAQRVLSGEASVHRDFVDELESLHPPSEVENAHNEILQLAGASVELLESAADRAAEVESLSGLAEVYAQLKHGPESEAFHKRWMDACQALEGIAADNGIQFDLDCE